ncbi:hypothetical protein HDU93_001132, partial [Gonapodya sp. JEL0774]
METSVATLVEEQQESYGKSRSKGLFLEGYHPDSSTHLLTDLDDRDAWTSEPASDESEGICVTHQELSNTLNADAEEEMAKVLDRNSTLSSVMPRMDSMMGLDGLEALFSISEQDSGLKDRQQDRSAIGGMPEVDVAGDAVAERFVLIGCKEPLQFAQIASGIKLLDKCKVERVVKILASGWTARAVRSVVDEANDQELPYCQFEGAGPKLAMFNPCSCSFLAPIWDSPCDTNTVSSPIHDFCTFNSDMESAILVGVIEFDKHPFWSAEVRRYEMLQVVPTSPGHEELLPWTGDLLPTWLFASMGLEPEADSRSRSQECTVGTTSHCDAFLPVVDSTGRDGVDVGGGAEEHEIVDIGAETCTEACAESVSLIGFLLNASDCVEERGCCTVIDLEYKVETAVAIRDMQPGVKAGTELVEGNADCRRMNNDLLLGDMK